MKNVRYAIVGFGGIAENRIAKEGFALDTSRFKPIPNVRCVGATDIAPARKTAARKLGLKWFDSVDDICQGKDVDAVFIATNNLSHYPIARQFLEAGKHVILEKPITTTLDHARELLELAARNGLSLTVDHMMLHNAYNIKASQKIQKGDLGDIHAIVLHMEFPYGFTAEEASTWRCFNPDEIGGPIGDVASHCMYMAEFLLKETITSIQAVYTPPVITINAENGAFIKFTTNNNTPGTIRVSFSEQRGGGKSTLLNLGYEVYGSKKTLRTYGTLFQLSGHSKEPIPLRLEIDDGSSSPRRVQVKKVQNIYRAVVQHHAHSILFGPRSSGQDALHNLDLVLKAHESAKRNGVTIQLS
jgi:predicted dehydrogenase